MSTVKSCLAGGRQRLSLIAKRSFTSLALLMSFSCVQVFSTAGTLAAAEPESQNGMPLVFEDGFEDGMDRWETTDAASWEILEVDGNHILGNNKRISDYKPKHRSPHNIAIIKDLSVEDVVITFRVKSTKDTGGHRDCCVFFGYQNPNQFYYVHLGAKPDPSSGQIMLVDNADRRPLSTNQNEVPWDDQWHNVKLVRKVSTGEISVYFDDMDKPLIHAVDKVFGAGKVGIGSFDDMNAFDDVKIFALSKTADAPSE